MNIIDCMFICSPNRLNVLDDTHIFCLVNRQRRLCQKYVQRARRDDCDLRTGSQRAAGESTLSSAVFRPSAMASMNWRVLMESSNSRADRSL